MSEPVDLWSWAVAVYAAPEVADACLALQDHHDQNVPLLLWAAWGARTGRRPDEETVEAACDMARAWQETVIAPLRSVRRVLKAPVPDLDDDARLGVREQVQAVELSAERRLLQALEALAPPPAGGARPALEGLAEASRAWSRVVPRPALIRLADSLPA